LIAANQLKSDKAIYDHCQPHRINSGQAKPIALRLGANRELGVGVICISEGILM
jgi:hypothetical protein